ncbi:hypothetical protein E2C01_102713 [Portunus trituberculatus]|uniref:Uncharacterized protein n=1 Tax=Portunus trituberculatus TaxID=210409 RepID=A0A5B7K8Y1_PORTR|nr:hypothetical protein [Portunus trituberculatus]
MSGRWCCWKDGTWACVGGAGRGGGIGV